MITCGFSNVRAKTTGKGSKLALRPGNKLNCVPMSDCLTVCVCVCVCVDLREREEDKEMAEFLRLKLTPLEEQLKVTQSECL